MELGMQHTAKPSPLAKVVTLGQAQGLTSQEGISAKDVIVPPPPKLRPASALVSSNGAPSGLAGHEQAAAAGELLCSVFTLSDDVLLEGMLR